MKQLLLTLILAAVVAAPSAALARTITEIIDATGDGLGNPLDRPDIFSLAVDRDGNVYVAGGDSDNAFRITPGGSITEIIDGTGDGVTPLIQAVAAAVDNGGNVYVAGGSSHTVFKITPAGGITVIIDSTGDGAGNPLFNPWDIDVGGDGSVYVGGITSNNAFKVAPDGTITEIIDSTGDGAGNPLNATRGVAVDATGNVYVAGQFSKNVFKITPDGAISEIIDATGDGMGNPLGEVRGVAVDAAGNVYAASVLSDNVFKITPGGTITEILDASGDGTGNTFGAGHGVAVDAAGNVYAPGFFTNNAFKIAPDGTITEIIDASGDGVVALDRPYAVAASPAGKVYVAGGFSDNVFAIALCGDGVQDTDEECDDGNLDPSDGCTDACTICGNGSITPPEECDDSGTAANDGCDPACRVEACFTCGAAPSVCTVLEDCIKCQRTIAKEAGKFAKTKSKALAKCELNKIKGMLPPLTVCEAESKTAVTLAKAASKLRAKIDKTCGGNDTECDGDPSEDMPDTLGWPTHCPNIEGSLEVECRQALIDCGEIAECLECTHETAVQQAMALYFEELIASDPEIEKTLNKCQQTIGKEAQKFLAKKAKELQNCWDKRLKGDHADTCPDAAAPLGTPARTAADKIAKAESQMRANSCKACGGADKLCDSVDDFLPGTIGFPTTCDAVTIPGGASCAGAVNTLQDLVGCVACVTEFKVDCMDAAHVPEFVPYPPECNP